MTHNQFPEYDYEPTLTTSELLRIERDERVIACVKVLKENYFMSDDKAYKAIAEHFDGDIKEAVAYANECSMNVTNGEGCYCKNNNELDGLTFKVWGYAEDDFNSDELEDDPTDSDELKAIKARIAPIVERMPFGDDSKKRVLANVAECHTAEELFWGFFFDYHNEPIASDFESRFPSLWAEFLALEKDNARLYKNPR